MIYDSFGSEVELLYYCGKHQKAEYRAPMMLVMVRYKEDGSEGYQFAHTLRADGGINEIDDVIDCLPEVSLTGSRLKEALKTAG